MLWSIVGTSNIWNCNNKPLTTLISFVNWTLHVFFFRFFFGKDIHRERPFSLLWFSSFLLYCDMVLLFTKQSLQAYTSFIRSSTEIKKALATRDLENSTYRVMSQINVAEKLPLILGTVFIYEKISYMINRALYPASFLPENRLYNNCKLIKLNIHIVFFWFSFRHLLLLFMFLK